MKITTDKIVEFLSAPDYQPMTASELQDALKLPEGQSRTLRKQLKRLENEGAIVQLRRKGYVVATSADLVSGTISFTRGGSAFVQDATENRELFIHRRDTGTALPGDHVLVRLKRGGGTASSFGHMRGKVIRVLKRNHTTVVGTLKKQRKLYYVEPMLVSITTDIVVPEKQSARIGDRVVVELIRWDDERLNPEGKIIEVIGQANNPTLDTASTIKAYHLPGDFPAEVVRQAANCQFDPDNAPDRLDLRQTFTFTIDPATARDFDDAITFEKKSNNKFVLGVHIADVSYFVRPGSALDREARKRGNSVYLPDTVIPMLPEQLSNGLCSLQEGVDRFAFSAMMTVKTTGEVIDVKFQESVINNNVRLTYEEALQILEAGAGGSPDFGRQITSKVKEVYKLTKTLRKNRFRDGALNLEIPEVEVITGEDGRIADVRTKPSDVAHQLIEECMLLANETVCKGLVKLTVPTIHRIHDEPNPERIAGLEEMFLTAGMKPGNLSDKNNLLRLVEQIRNAPQAHAWNVAILRAMKKAEYSTKNIGHYGLAKTHYTHFTSPIRRYADLIIHRILKAALSRKSAPYNEGRLAEIAQRCCERELLASRAERDIIELKVLRYFSEQLESGKPSPHDAVVIDVKNFGLMIDLPEIQATGLIPVSMLTEDFFDYNPVRRELRGRRRGQTYGIGSTLSVIIAKVNPERRFLDFVPC